MVFKKKGLNLGLTVLELFIIVAIAAIALLVIKVSATDLQTRYRDSVRISHINEISKALGVYRDQNQKYPIMPVETIISGIDDLSVTLKNEFTLKTALVDPLYPSYAYTYMTDANGADYVLTFCLEKKNDNGYKIGCGNAVKPNNILEE